jgi:nucleotide-binding universal stress UspA family protein
MDAPESETARGEPPRVVVGVDGSPGSMDALKWAVGYARMVGAVLEVVHARFIRKDILDLIDEAEAEESSVLESAVAAAHELDGSLQVVGRIDDPPAAKRLIDASRDALTLVVGSRGFGGFRELTLGSVSQQCVHHAHCPVVVIRPHPSE